MEKSFALSLKDILYNVRLSKRARTVRLSVHRNGTVTLTVPARPHIPLSHLERFIQEKSAWIRKHIARFARSPRTLLVENTRTNFRTHKAQALTLVQERISHLNAIYQYPIGTVRIRNQSTRWGSCSKKGNLSFNYRIALLPESVRDYIIAHELCHVREFNHSKKFWDLVAQTVPNYRAIKKQLRAYSI